MPVSNPLVSIGIPVYNEERYLSQALDSLLGQTYKHFEIVISDNASTDSTESICEKYAAADSRIRYIRSELDKGAIANFNRTFQESKGEYFMWAGGHDWWDPGLLEDCVGGLSSSPNHVASFGVYQETDPNGRFVRVLPLDLDTRALSCSGRLRKTIRGYSTGVGFLLYSLMRADAMRKTHGLVETYGFDFLFICELSLTGEFCHVPEARSFVRAFHDRKRNRFENSRTLLGAESIGKKNERTIRNSPFTGLAMQAWRVIFAAQIPMIEKVGLFLEVIRQLDGYLPRELSSRLLPERVRASLRRT